MRSRRMIRIVMVQTALIVMLGPWLFGAEQDPVAPNKYQHRTEEDLKTKRRKYLDFDEWAGKVRIPGKKVEESPFSAESFSQWSDLVWEREGGSQFSWKYGESQDIMERTEVRLRVSVLGSPREAADTLMVFMFETMSMGKLVERAVEGKYFVGDAAFLFRRGLSRGEPGPLFGLAFVRNNVAAMVVVPQAVSLEDLASFIDSKLVEALKPTDDPAFSNNLEEPPAEGDVERSLAARRAAVNARDEQWWATVRKRVDFDEWAGKVKIAGKRVVRCPVDAANFRKWSGSVEERHFANDSYFGWGADAEKHSISMRVCASPRDAADRLMYTLFKTAWTRPGGKVTEGNLLVGDVAFPMINLDPSVQNNRLAFVRNNVFVMVTAPSRELLEELATFVDGKLVEAMMPPDDPAFSNKRYGNRIDFNDCADMTTDELTQVMRENPDYLSVLAAAEEMLTRDISDEQAAQTRRVIAVMHAHFPEGGLDPEKELDEILELYPDTLCAAGIALNLASRYNSVAPIDIAKAEKYYRWVLDHIPEGKVCHPGALAHLELGAMKGRLGSQDEAKKHFEAIYSMDPALAEPVRTDGLQPEALEKAKKYHSNLVGIIREKSRLLLVATCRRETTEETIAQLRQLRTEYASDEVVVAGVDQALAMIVSVSDSDVKAIEEELADPKSPAE